MFSNATIEGSPCPRIEDNEISHFQKVLATNVTGVFLGIKHASRVMIPRKQGCILMSGSVSSVAGGFGLYAYTALKSVIIDLMKNTAVELGQFGIIVKCISSFLIVSSLATDFFTIKGVKGVKDWVCQLATLKGTILTGEDFAKTAVFFESDDSKFVSGHNFMIDGGVTTTNLAFGLFNYS
ncbi:hypothetical protein GIB67_015308 [Kingdonia uniflora]|uniref:Uncharacterized protein n=1 Tax=Kingdonia uniflora TaxID=39325 RepID=A0A7J7KYJ7_9MAGN|nr:hypothetical protein GIB67_015308 [Kingdonia uniflora]